MNKKIYILDIAFFALRKFTFVKRCEFIVNKFSLYLDMGHNQ